MVNVQHSPESASGDSGMYSGMYCTKKLFVTQFLSINKKKKNSPTHDTFLKSSVF